MAPPRAAPSAHMGESVVFRGAHRYIDGTWAPQTASYFGRFDFEAGGQKMIRIIFDDVCVSTIGNRSIGARPAIYISTGGHGPLGYRVRFSPVTRHCAFSCVLLRGPRSFAGDRGMRERGRQRHAVCDAATAALQYARRCKPPEMS